MSPEHNMSYEKPVISVQGKNINLSSSFYGDPFMPRDFSGEPFMQDDLPETTIDK